ncbi:2-keto-4-pentenoate hydratase/2-oxohepta-3-ene-1,7-dioic acid hydratase (catechol pathway) [Geosmithia morbida]|uniref:2-keto-4-pentenoate hydratase/2-oxohepta-3-ene-1,7-dioic acid hydratase (Catechol pathway) n=1 Tax=Geosmithia morbida TaxID=1094350 RepID=A0A9P4YUZ8_9HYPO|nr:2-keto-4-pentenoate hydratase/2-oxohepta-3-ene-1,7-dioic acid hydratase (catechol pathway) [Geosmithia morbida]KAF4121499.1 2-keto-4-pentenoate hydratase/2-oxohepta-3-ene-1,7-dioic acid hydratase (catechol pathway) [Geosmithia morbida]
MAAQQFRRLVRFIPTSDLSKRLIGQPSLDDIDVGLALFNGTEVAVDVFSGTSVLRPGVKTGVTETVERLLSPLDPGEVGTIRCIGLNYKNHAKEVGLDLPTVPTVFLKPSNSLGGPWPEPTVLPKLSQLDDCGDYESELAVVIGKDAKNVPESEAMDYVLGYTACNDISSRSPQFGQSQWCFSKGFDGSCPIGPTLVSPSLIPDPSRLRIRGLKNDEVMQDGGLDDLIFSIPSIISFLSQSTTLPAGTVIITGTPAGVGFGKSPRVTLRHDDVFKVEITPYIGTLVNKMQNE